MVFPSCAVLVSTLASISAQISALLMRSKESDTDVVLIDFGLAARCGDFEDIESFESYGGGNRAGYLGGGNNKRRRPRRTLTQQCGTPSYVAPEVLAERKYGVECDIWSTGVVLFILLGGYQPFHDDDETALFNKIAEAAYDFDMEWWATVSWEGKDLISKMLLVDQDDRLSAQECLAHPWFKAKGGHRGGAGGRSSTSSRGGSSRAKTRPGNAPPGPREMFEPPVNGAHGIAHGVTRLSRGSSRGPSPLLSTAPRDDRKYVYDGVALNRSETITPQLSHFAGVTQPAQLPGDQSFLGSSALRGGVSAGRTSGLPSGKQPKKLPSQLLAELEVSRTSLDFAPSANPTPQKQRQPKIGIKI